MEAAERTGKLMELRLDELNYPGKSEEVLTTSAFIEVGFGDEVDRKF